MNHQKAEPICLSEECFETGINKLLAMFSGKEVSDVVFKILYDKFKHSVPDKYFLLAIDRLIENEKFFPQNLLATIKSYVNYEKIESDRVWEQMRKSDAEIERLRKEGKLVSPEKIKKSVEDFKQTARFA